MVFGYRRLLAPGQHWYDNRVFDLMVQRTYGVMTNDTLLSVPLFVFMGYVMERAALVDRMFHSVQLAFRRVPASLAVTTLLVCAFWGIASGIVGAVVVLMGVIALRPMLNAGYDVRLASGAITAGGTLGILIPPSVMLIVYAAVAGQSIVKLYAAAMLPGFFLTFLYLAYILGLGDHQPEDRAQACRPDQYRLAVPGWLRGLERGPVAQRRSRARRRRRSGPAARGAARRRTDARGLRSDRHERAGAPRAGAAHRRPRSAPRGGTSSSTTRRPPRSAGARSESAAAARDDRVCTPAAAARPRPIEETPKELTRRRQELGIGGGADRRGRARSADAPPEEMDLRAAQPTPRRRTRCPRTSTRGSGASPRLSALAAPRLLLAHGR